MKIARFVRKDRKTLAFEMRGWAARLVCEDQLNHLYSDLMPTLTVSS